MAAPRQEIRLEDKLPEPISHYTDAVRCGDFLFMSGAGPFDKDLKLIGQGDVAAQARATCENIEKMLDAAGMSFQDIAYFKILLDNVRDQDKINPVRQTFFGDARPAGVLVGVQELALPGMMIEIEAVAYKPSGGAPARQEIVVDGLAPPRHHETHVVKCGDFAFFSLMGPLDANGNAAHVGDPLAQAEVSHQNMQRMAEAAGMDLSDVAKVTVWIEKVADRQLLNPARAKYFGKGRPTSAMIGTKELAVPGFHHAIECIAYKASPGNAPRKEWVVENYREPISHYTDAVQCGDILFVSGAGGINKDLSVVGERDCEMQAEKTFENIGRMLDAAGFTFDEVVKVSVYHTHVLERTMINPVRKKVFPNTLPASTLFGIKELALEPLRLEIESVAYRAGAGKAA